MTISLEWTPVYGSSNVIGCRYDEGRREVEVRFRDGAEYAYFDVPIEVYQQLLSAPSKGRFVQIVLRRGYAYERRR